MVTEAQKARLFRRVDATSLAIFERVIGLILAVAVIRFFAYDWIARLYAEPKIHFHYFGFSFIEPFPEPWLSAWFVGLGVIGLALLLGANRRWVIALAFVAFGYVELLDVTTYLNHYYLLSCLLFIAWLTPRPRLLGTVPAWSLYLFRFQVGLIYVFAGLAKLEADWLFRGEPLGSWLVGRTELGPLGALFETRGAAIAMAWAGMIFDLTVVGFLSFRRTRRFAFGAVVFFHVVTAWLFPIGVFPWVMIAGATLFFDPSWPRRFVEHWARAPLPSVGPSHAWIARLRAAVVLGHVALQLWLPLRHFAYPGPVAWTEEGFRFSWRVMLVEKHGIVRYSVSVPGEAKSYLVYPSQYLTPLQEQQMGSQPDLILQLAHHIARDFEAKGHLAPQVRAEAWVSKNGGPLELLIDPEVDLAKVEDSLFHKDWIRH